MQASFGGLGPGSTAGRDCPRVLLPRIAASA
jgi:hypothetical protein